MGGGRTLRFTASVERVDRGCIEVSMSAEVWQELGGVSKTDEIDEFPFQQGTGHLPPPFQLNTPSIHTLIIERIVRESFIL